MARRLIEYDPLSGVYTYHHYDDETRTTAIETVQDVAPHLEVAKALANDDSYSAKGKKDCFWHVAHLPVGLITKWLHEKGVNVFQKDHWPAVRQLINDRDFSGIRTGRGRV